MSDAAENPSCLKHLKAILSRTYLIAIFFTLPEFDHLLEYRPLYDYINARYTEGKDNFVLIDEVQMGTGFERAINGLHASEKFVSFPPTLKILLSGGFKNTSSQGWFYEGIF